MLLSIPCVGAEARARGVPRARRRNASRNILVMRTNLGRYGRDCMDSPIRKSSSLHLLSKIWRREADIPYVKIGRRHQSMRKGQCFIFVLPHPKHCFCRKFHFKNVTGMIKILYYLIGSCNRQIAIRVISRLQPATVSPGNSLWLTIRYCVKEWQWLPLHGY